MPTIVVVLFVVLGVAKKGQMGCWQRVCRIALHWLAPIVGKMGCGAVQALGPTLQGVTSHVPMF